MRGVQAELPGHRWWITGTGVLDLKFVRDNVELVKERLASRGEAPAALDELIQIDVEQRAILAEVERLRQRRNELSKEGAELKRQGKSTSDVVARVAAEGPLLNGLEKQLKEKEEILQEVALFIPNLPHDAVPVGKSPEDNVEVRRWGTVRRFAFEPKAHWELG